MELGMGVKSKVESAKLRFNQERPRKILLKDFTGTA